MKVLKDPYQVLRIMDAKLDELQKKFDEADGKEATEISGQEIAIIRIAGYIRHAIDDHGYFENDYFGVTDMACVYGYVADARRKDREYSNARDTWLNKGIAKGAIWACVVLEDRMKQEP